VAQGTAETGFRNLFNPTQIMKFSRLWAMPNSSTFEIPAIYRFVQKYLMESRVSIDPFARNKRWATWTNDINPTSLANDHMEARVFLRQLILNKVKADLIIFDPPYSPRQISEHYKAAGVLTTKEDTQNARLYSECRDLFVKLATDDAIVLSFGWNSAGMGKVRGFDQIELMLVCHGAAHNDTICLSERKLD
jgi:hypothetical protein